MTLAIIAAMAPEAAQLQAALADREEIHHGHHSFHQGRLAGVPVVLSQCGIGKVHAAIATTLLIQRWAPTLVINTGSAGGLAPGQRQGDIVIAAETAHHDVDVGAFGYAKGQLPACPPRFAADPEAVALAAELAGPVSAALGGRCEAPGLIVSGDQFIHDPADVARIRRDFPEARALEMEAAAIAQTCQRLQTPWLVIRALSDLADGGAALSFDEFLPLASQHSAELVRALVAAWAQRQAV